MLELAISLAHHLATLKQLDAEKLRDTIDQAQMMLPRDVHVYRLERDICISLGDDKRMSFGSYSNGMGPNVFWHWMTETGKQAMKYPVQYHLNPAEQELLGNGNMMFWVMSGGLSPSENAIDRLPGRFMFCIFFGASRIIPIFISTWWSGVFSNNSSMCFGDTTSFFFSYTVFRRNGQLLQQWQSKSQSSEI